MTDKIIIVLLGAIFLISASLDWIEFKEDLKDMRRFEEENEEGEDGDD